jgi:vacuolar-type H+-ATPase subunit F/Vma7
MTPLFIGDEVTAAAYRLAGARTVIPDAGSVLKVLEAVIGETKFLVITAACAAELPREWLASAVRRAEPLVLIVPDIANRAAPPDLVGKVDRVLGIGS